MGSTSQYRQAVALTSHTVKHGANFSSYKQLRHFLIGSSTIEIGNSSKESCETKLGWSEFQFLNAGSRDTDRQRGNTEYSPGSSPDSVTIGRSRGPRRFIQTFSRELEATIAQRVGVASIVVLKAYSLLWSDSGDTRCLKSCS